MQLFVPGKLCVSAYNLFYSNTLPYLLVYIILTWKTICYRWIDVHSHVKSLFLLVLIFPVYMLCLQFFVAVDYDTKYDRLWYEKYSIRKPMLPSFITMELGTKVSLVVDR